MKKQYFIYAIVAGALLVTLYSFKPVTPPKEVPYVPNWTPPPPPPPKPDMRKIGYNLGKDHGSINFIGELYGPTRLSPSELRYYAELILENAKPNLYRDNPALKSNYSYLWDKEKSELISSYCRGYADGFHDRYGRAF